ncbi:MAG: MFS transporter [Anaerolineae bacterium]
MTKSEAKSQTTNILQNRDFLRLWVGQTVSQFGSMLGALSLLAILTLQATPAQMGVLETMKAVPALLFGLPAGVWVDRKRRRPFLLIADMGRFGFLVLVVIAALRGVLQMRWLYLTGFLVGSLTVLFDIAYRAYLPALVTRKQLVEANSKLSITESLAEIASPGLGGVLVQLITAPLTLLLDAFSFLLSAMFIWRIQQPEPEPNTDAAETIWQSIRDGLAFLWAERPLRTLTAATATWRFFGGFFAALYGLYVLREIGLSPAWLGVLVGAGGIGALLGATLMPRLTDRLGLARLLQFSLIFIGLIGFLIPLAGFLPRGAATAVLFTNQLLGDIGIAFFLIGSLTMLQTLTPDVLLGRVNAGFEFLTGISGTAGIFIGGLLGEFVGIRPSLFIAVTGFLLAGLWLLPQRRRKN